MQPLLPYGTFDETFSIGKKCQPAGRLKRLGLRQMSGPFDWFANQQLPEVHRIMESGTKHLFRPENTKKTGFHKDCAVFKDMATGFVSMHDIPIASITSGDEARVLRDMVTKIERRRLVMLDAIGNSRRVLFVRLNAELPKVERFKSYLEKVFPETQTEILVIKEKAGSPISVHKTGMAGIYCISGDNAPSGEKWLGSDHLWEAAMVNVSR